MSWVLIAGASSGIGRAVAGQWAAAGNNILLAGRDLDDLGRTAADLSLRYGIRAEALPLDVLDFSRHAAFFSEALAKAEGRIDGVVIAHGLLPDQAEAQTNLDVLRSTIDTNYTSAASLLNLIAGDFEKRRSGFICVVTSVAGDRGRQSNYVYASTKAGLTAYLQGLRQRVAKANVSVTNVKPGFVDTAMIWGKPGVFWVAPPERIARDTYRAVRRGRGEIYTPWFWRWVMLLVRSIPDVVYRRMKF
jgi:short-subunit dehydrogenase